MLSLKSKMRLEARMGREWVRWKRLRSVRERRVVGLEGLGDRDRER